MQYAMANEFIHTPVVAKRPAGPLESTIHSYSVKRRRTKEDFVNFCNFVLEYTQYESMRQEDIRTGDNVSPPGSESSGSENYSFLSSPTNSDKQLQAATRTTDVESDEDSYNMISCFCGKPFAKRPMIECSRCETWLHLSCAKVRKTHIPETFVCPLCRQSDVTARKSARMRTEKRLESL